MKVLKADALGYVLAPFKENSIWMFSGLISGFVSCVSSPVGTKTAAAFTHCAEAVFA